MLANMWESSCSVFSAVGLPTHRRLYVVSNHGMGFNCQHDKLKVIKASFSFGPELVAFVVLNMRYIQLGAYDAWSIRYSDWVRSVRPWPQQSGLQVPGAVRGRSNWRERSHRSPPPTDTSVPPRAPTAPVSTDLHRRSDAPRRHTA